MNKTRIAWIVMIVSFALFFYKAFLDINMEQPMLTTMAFTVFLLSTLSAIFLGNAGQR
jgi:FtsH-binding integral membrane protein